MMLLCLVVFAPFSIKAQCVLPFGQVSPWQAKYFVQVGEAEPANDASGNTWKDLDYDDSSWGTLTGPMGTSGLQLFTPNFTINDEYTHFFLRRTFTIGDIADSYRLRLLNDDDLVVYLNGNYIIGNGNNIFYIEGSAFVQGTNVLSIYYKAQGVPNYLDYELCVNEDNVIQEDGTFTTIIENGIRMAFKVIDEEARTVQVGTGNASAIDPRIAGAITIPTTANGYNVVSIGQDAFSGCSQITSVVVPEGVSEIKGGAFGLCGNLQAISLPTTLRIMGDVVFEGCGSLDNVVIPPGIESIPWGLFMDCRGLSKFEIPNTVTTIGCYAFENCDNLKTVIIPNSVKSIGGMSFRGGLETVYSYIEDPFEIEDGTFYGWGDHTDATLYVPAGTIDKYRNTPHWDQFLNIREMGEAQLDVPQTYTDDQGVIYTLDTESMTYTVTGHIDDFNLNVVIPSTLFDLPVTRIGNDALGWSELGSVVLPEGIVTIGMNAISDCQISSLYIPSTITSLYPNDDNPFSCNQQLSQIQVAEGNTVYDSREGCNAIIETATNKLIAGCNSTIIPESVVSIGPDAFYGCQFSTITIPARVTSIGSISFMSCDQLSTIYAMMPTPANLDEGAFQQNHYTNVTLYVPKGKKSAYLNAKVWSNFQNIVEMEPVAGYTQVGEQQMTLTVEEMKSQYSHAKFDIDKTVIASALGCNSDDIVEQILSSDGTLTDQANISPTIWGLNNIMISVDYGFWYNSEGYSDDYPTGVAAIVAIENEPSTYYLIQVPNSYHGGDNYSLDYYFTYDNKYYVYHVQVNVVEKSIKRLSEMTKVGGQEIVLNENLDTNYQFVPFDVDWEAITESLGCEQGEIIDMALKADGELDYESTATPCGFWFNADGYVDKWGINAVMAITKESTYGIIQYPNALSSGESFAVNYYLTYEDKYYELNVVLNITIELNEFIDFADAEVKRICVENWDTNGDGELSYAEAAAVTDLGQVFKNNTIITFFEELAFFTGINEIPEHAFTGCEKLQSVSIPNQVTKIGHNSFWSSGLKSIYIPASVTESMSQEFYDCTQLESIVVDPNNPKYDSRQNCNAIIETATNKLISGCMNTTIPNGVTTIGQNAFGVATGLTQIEIPHSVTTIEYEAFTAAGLTSLVLPSIVQYLSGTNDFRGCADLESIVVEEGNSKFDSRDNCNAIIETSTNKLVAGCKNTIIPESVTTIGQWAFDYIVGLETISLPSNVETIEERAFCNTGITTIDLPKSVSSIGNDAFLWCHKLNKVTVHWTTPISINTSAFPNRSQTTLYIPYGCKSIYEDAEVWKEFKEIVEMEMDPDASIDFADAEVKRICVENWDSNGDGELSYGEAAAVETIGTVFKQNWVIESFEELQYFTSLEELDEYCFSYCNNLEKLSLPNSLKSLGRNSLFCCSKLSEIILPPSLEVIDTQALEGCSSLKTLYIPSKVQRIGIRGVSNCRSLETIVVSQDNQYYSSPDNCNAIIKKDELLAGCVNTIIPNNIHYISSNAFAGIENLQDITLPDGLLSIGSEAFRGCESLTGISIPESVETIGDHAFCDCFSISSIYIPKNVRSIGWCITSTEGKAFASIVVDSDNPYYDSRDNCNAIIHTATNKLISDGSNTVIPTSVTSLGAWTFYGLDVKEVVIPNQITTIGSGSYGGCFNLESLTLPASITEIAGDAFRYASKLKTVYAYMKSPVALQASFYDVPLENVTLYVPYGSKSAYETADVWKDFKEIIEVKPDNFLYAEETTMKLGSKKTIALQLDNVTPLIAAEFRLQLPAGLAIEKDENNNLVAAIVGDRRVNHTLTVKDEGNGLYHFLSYSNPIRAYNGNSGDFITLSIVSDGSMEEGTYTATLKSIIFSDENEQKLTFDDCSFNISVIDYTTGDANGDGSIDVMDVVKMVSHIMGRNPSNFNQIAADIDGNGKVNVMDLVNLINLIMSTPQQTSAIAPHAQSGSMELSRNGDEAITVSIPFADRHVAAQFVVSLTDGAVLQEVMADEAHQSKFTRMSDGRYKVMVFSGSNAAFNSNSPIRLQLSGNGDVKIEDALFVDTDEEAVIFESAALNTTGINAVGTTFAQSVDIYTVGGKLVKNGATSTKGLAKGVYVVNNQKLIVK